MAIVWRKSRRGAQSGAVLLMAAITLGAHAQAFGPSNPFYAPSALPYHAPPFDKIRDSDYRPAIEAGIAQQLAEIEAIANNPAAPTFENTLVAMERTGQLLARVTQVFDAVAQANTNPVLQKVQEIEAPKRAALADAITLNSKLFARIAKLYSERDTLSLDAESRRLLEIDYQQYVKAGANLSDADKTKLKKLNEEESILSTAFTTKLLAATRAAAYSTTDKSALAGLSDSQLAAAAAAANERKQPGYLVPLQNTRQHAGPGQDVLDVARRGTGHEAAAEVQRARAGDEINASPAGLSVI